MVDVSKTRSEDRADRVNLLEAMKLAVRIYQRTSDPEHLSFLKRLGKYSIDLSEKIKTKDYSREDCFENLYVQLARRQKPLCTCGNHPFATT